MKTTPKSDYFLLAAKQVPWPVDLKEKSILVPESELLQAEDNLMVSHLRRHGFFIQSTIENVEKTKIFSVDLRKVVTRVKRDETYRIGDRFLIKSTSTVVEVVQVQPKVRLAYRNLPPKISKPDLLTSVEQLKKYISLGYWEQI